MKEKFLIALFGLLISTLNAQKNMDSLAVSKDLKIFENILKKGHPGLYQYIKQDSLEYIFNTAKESINDSLTDIDLYKKMLSITNEVKDGHLLLFAPNTIKTDQYYFPLILKIINTQFYTDTDDFNIPIGSKINTINGQDTSRILENLKKYVATDGHNLTRKYREIELKFGLFYAYEYGISKNFSITYTTPDGIKNDLDLDAESFIKVKLRNTKRNSYFAKYHQKKNNFDYFDKHINNKAPFVYYKDELNTAVLVINSFGGDISQFKSKLIKIFREINKKKIEHLVIDIRQNDGGYRPNSVHLYSFITKNPFKQIKSQSIISLSVPEKKYATRVFLNEKDFLEDKFKNHPTYDGWRITFDDLETIMAPQKNRFNGKVYILISGATFSAASAFALNAKNNPDITLIGEETGGGYYKSFGMFPVYYELPNSKITMVMSMVQIEQYTKETSIPLGSGIPPDKNIIHSVEDLILGKDAELDYIFRLIKG
ncbi:hypothetical protein D1816_00280 [Aquimarina sp. AD10]|uniref:Tail specific protease domain-containing protein n=1 Tax=Aquimarina aggregata TaxID=1642818 RepID=A0A162FDL7_9FLAO|nr:MULTISPECIES: S41 family peptidase [Aquimarina]AXT58848.1 hypothetical protein D1816_00280 [Aquimarina sp. AD10]KZS41706.1 hypothetical protein AWE51_20120 [Aquimarina aggregata]RKM99677.1 hypothetical protein D7033_10935 [Aquimarina sp. AD10]